MNFWDFGAIFVDFSEARDLFVNISEFWTELEKLWTAG
jgi:hypothetical protein